MSDISHWTGISKTSVSKIKQKQLPDRENIPPGRAKTMTGSDICYVTRLIMANKCENSAQVVSTLNETNHSNVSPRTIRRESSKLGMKVVSKKKSPLQKKLHKTH